MRSFLQSSLIACALALASCTPITDLRGHNNEQADFTQVVPGQTRSDDVLALLGSPSATSSFGDKTWYYITEKKETAGMFAPEVIDQHVTAIRFNADDTVAEISKTGKGEAKEVDFVEKETPTEGRKLSAMEQLLGNFGKFSTPGRQIDPRNLGR